MGDGVKRICESEVEMRLISRKSIIAAKNLSVGHRLEDSDLEFRRPGTGISPMRYKELLGKKVKSGISAGENVILENLTDE